VIWNKREIFLWKIKKYLLDAKKELKIQRKKKYLCGEKEKPDGCTSDYSLFALIFA
jgi:hypothetical protein